MRIACFFIPLFPLAARLRSEPELRGNALAIVEGSGSAARVYAATRRARKFGIRPGLSLAQARAIIPNLVARGRDPECERAAQEALLEIAESLSPRVEDAGEGVVFVDLEGLSRIYGMQNAECRSEKRSADEPPRSRNAEKAPEVPRTPLTLPLGMTARHTVPDAQWPAANDQRPTTNDILNSAFSIPSSWESHFAQSALHAVERAGLPARLGIASSKLAARVAAELPETPTIVPAGEEETFLAPLPLGRLSLEMEIGERLDRWGLRSIGDFANLPEGEIASRLGEAGRALHQAARGIDPRPLIPRVPPPDFREGMDLEWALVAIEPFLFVAHAALDRLSQRLATHGLSCRKLELQMRLEPDGHHIRAIDLPAPTREVKTLLTLVRLDLEDHPPGAPVAGFVFIAHPDEPRTAQLSLYGPLEISPDRLATTIARLAALVGSDRVGTPGIVDSHRPGVFTIADHAPPPPPKIRREAVRNRGLLAVRVLRPAMEIEVKKNNEVRTQNAEFRIQKEDRQWAVGGGERALSIMHEGTNCHPEERSDEGSQAALTPAYESYIRVAGDPSLPTLPAAPAQDDKSSHPAQHPSPTLTQNDPPVSSSSLAPRPSSLAPRPSSLAPRPSTFSTQHSAFCIPSHIALLHPDKSTPKIDGRVRVASGPWRMEEGWWSGAPVEREYWDVELERGGIYRIYRDGDGRWFVDGMYD